MPLNHLRYKKTTRGGVAALEFLFAAPAFFVLVFFVVEIALTWNDRHIMRLAAYRAAKSVVKTRSEQGISSGLCWAAAANGGQQDANNKDVQVRARRAATKLMATVTPSITQMLTMFGNPLASSQTYENFITNDTIAQFGDDVHAIASNRYVHAIVRMMKGLPSAWLLTELRCTNVTYPVPGAAVDTPGVEITLLYHRPAKMPYVGTIIWVLHWLHEFSANDDGTSGMVRINPLDYGVDVHFDIGSPQAQAVLTQLQQRTRQILVETANEIAVRTQQSKIEKSQSIPFNPPLGSILSTSGAQVFGAIAGSGFDKVVSDAQQWQTRTLSPAQSAINFVANSAIQLLISAPDELKTIPIQVTVRIPNFNQAIVNDGVAFTGKTVAIGALGGNEKIGKMAKMLSKVIDDVKPLPYVTGPSGN